jgi:serine/threonine protein kinase
MKHRSRHRYRFSEAQILKIAEDLLVGLKSMHERGFVHRDLHEGNIMFRKSSEGLFEAALIDFGQTLRAVKAKDEIPQAARSRNPPEALLTPFAQIDRYRADVYALACNFYRLVWGQSLPWSYAYDIHDMKSYSHAMRKNFFERIVREYSATKISRIGELEEKIEMGAPLSKFERLKLLTFRMLSVNPAQRPTCAEALAQLEEPAI